MTVSRDNLSPSDPSHPRVTGAKPVAGIPRRAGVALVALASLVCCTVGGPLGCQANQLKNESFGPTAGEVAGIAAGVGAAVVVTIVLVNKAHHSVKGCVFAGKDGLDVQTQDNMKTYALAGVTENIKVGDLVQFHGSKVKKVKDSTAYQTFTVQKIGKDYGPCMVKQGAGS